MNMRMRDINKKNRDEDDDGGSEGGGMLLFVRPERHLQLPSPVSRHRTKSRRSMARV